MTIEQFEKGEELINKIDIINRRLYTLIPCIENLGDIRISSKSCSSDFIDVYSEARDIILVALKSQAEKELADLERQFSEL